MPRMIVFFLSITLHCISIVIEAHQQEASQPALNRHAITFATDEGYVFDAMIVAPAESLCNGKGILLLGGGVANDLNWTVPGFTEMKGKQHQMTITGQAHSDATRLADALANHGFVVMHWSTIRRNDPKREKWPNEATVYPMQDQLRHAKAALAALREQPRIKDKRIFLLGHSLGAVRATNIAAQDTQIAGLILLGAAQLTRTTADDRGHNKNRDATRQFLNLADTDHNGKCSRGEFDHWRTTWNDTDHAALFGQRFDQLDFDRDGILNPWEISAGIARENRKAMDFDQSPTDGTGLLWTEDVLQKHKIPTLIVYGALDNSQSHHAPVIAEIINNEKLNHIKIEIIPGVGHQLGPEEDGRVGPISKRTLAIITKWLESTTFGR